MWVSCNFCWTTLNHQGGMRDPRSISMGVSVTDSRTRDSAKRRTSKWEVRRRPDAESSAAWWNGHYGYLFTGEVRSIVSRGR